MPRSCRSLSLHSFIFTSPPPPPSPLFPYTTLFRSNSTGTAATGSTGTVATGTTTVIMPRCFGPGSGGACCWLFRWCSPATWFPRSEEHTSELQSRFDLVCRLLLEKKKEEQHRNIEL